MTNKTWFHEGDENIHCGRWFTRANAGLCLTQTWKTEKLKVDCGCNQDTEEGDPWAVHRKKSGWAKDKILGNINIHFCA